MRNVAFPSLAVAATLALASCGSDDLSDATDELGEDAIESIARNIASESGEEQFAESGNEIDGELECEATVVTDKLSKVEIHCTGVVEGGGDAELNGATNELPGGDFDRLDGLFKATVDGNEVFATDQLGD